MRIVRYWNVVPREAVAAPLPDVVKDVPDYSRRFASRWSLKVPSNPLRVYGSMAKTTLELILLRNTCIQSQICKRISGISWGFMQEI